MNPERSSSQFRSLQERRRGQTVGRTCLNALLFYLRSRSPLLSQALVGEARLPVPECGDLLEDKLSVISGWGGDWALSHLTKENHFKQHLFQPCHRPCATTSASL